MKAQDGRKKDASCYIPTSNKELPLHREDIPGNVITFPKTETNKRKNGEEVTY